jgi:ketosteroid isomerase-like protein
MAGRDLAESGGAGGSERSFTMTNKYCLFVLLLCLAGAAFAQGSAVEQAVLKAEQSWVDSLLKSDTAALDALYAETLVYTHSSGSVDDKAKYIAAIKSGATKYLSIDREEVKVNVYGAAAVVTCKVMMKLTANGENRTVNARMIHVYAKQKGRWQMVAHQTTRLG